MQEAALSNFLEFLERVRSLGFRAQRIAREDRAPSHVLWLRVSSISPCNDSFGFMIGSESCALNIPAGCEG